ncbi:MAG TPA: hypothetical protein VKV37_22980 [Ktedonobacteraceae bacterium]|jgi:hypothetical protein|nr:hypothetical protein [Ktedonobacteraceae bacterium]
MYTLDFATMKQVMQEHQKTGFLYAEVPLGVADRRGRWRVEIKLVSGSIVSCSLIDESGRRLPEAESIRKLARLGPLHWTFVPQAVVARPALTPPHPPGNLFFPQRIVQVEQWQMRSWPRVHRAIFALADGTRSAAKIAEMLSLAPDLVEKALRDLQAIGVITLGPYSGRNGP